MSPRLVGPPGLGKTTLASVVAAELGRPLFIFQCTMDTRPEDLIIAPVLSSEGRIEYRASALLTAVLTGGVVILDEGNRMNERAWVKASIQRSGMVLAPAHRPVGHGRWCARKSLAREEGRTDDSLKLAVGARRMNFRPTKA
jgi:hypothetical protein